MLDTGSSTSVRNTAAKQLAQLAAKSIISDVAIEEDIKSNRQHVSLGDPSAWAELMAVVARVNIPFHSSRLGKQSDLSIQIIPFLHSKSYETRTAASVALSQIFSLVPLWQPSQGLDTKSASNPTISLPAPDFPAFSVHELILQGKLLLASSGKEFVKPSGILSSSSEVKKARKEAMGRLGLEFLDNVADEMDLEKELADDVEPDGDVEMDTVALKTEDLAQSMSPIDVSMHDLKAKADRCPPARSVTPTASSPTTSNVPDVDLGALSARERNRLKRKRKPGNSAFVAAPPPQSSGAKYSAAPAGSNKYVVFHFTQ